MKKLLFTIVVLYSFNSFADFIPQNLNTLDFGNLEFTLSKVQEGAQQKNSKQKFLNNQVSNSQKTTKHNNVIHNTSASTQKFNSNNSANIRYIPVYYPIKIPVYYPVYIPRYIPIY